MKKGPNAKGLLMLSQQASEATDKGEEAPPPPPPPPEKKEEDIINELDLGDMKFPPPSPRTAHESTTAGRKAVGVVKFLELHQLILTCLQPNIRGERDFKALRTAIEETDASAEMGRLLRNVRQEMKKLYGERRKRKQLMAWDNLEQAVGIRDSAQARVKAVDSAAVLSRAWAVEQLVSKWFMDRTFFDEYFIRELSVHLVGLLARGERSPGSILSMPRVVIDKIVYLHLMRCKDRFHELHRMFFSDLFTPADIEIAVLSACDCKDCVADWGVKKIEQRELDAHVRFHWTQEKAKQAIHLLRAHLKFGNEVALEMVGKQIPKMRSWNEADFKSVLRTVHTCASCYLCQKRPNHRHRPHAGKTAAANAAASSSGDGAVSDHADGSIKETPTGLDLPLPASTPPAASKFTKRLKDTPQTRPIGPGAKRKIRQALADQVSKHARVADGGHDPSGGDAEQAEIRQAIAKGEAGAIESGLANPETLRALFTMGVLQPLGVSVSEDGVVAIGDSSQEKKALGKDVPEVQKPGDDTLRQLTELVRESGEASEALMGLVREKKYDLHQHTLQVDELESSVL